MSDWNEAIQKMQSGSPLSTPAAQGTVALSPLALVALEHRRQLDVDGVEIAVSRQAFDELLAAYKTAVDHVNRATDAEIGGIHRSFAPSPEALPAGGVEFTGDLRRRAAAAEAECRTDDADALITAADIIDSHYLMIASLQDQLSAAIFALRPFADAIEGNDDPKISDGADIWEAPLAMNITYGHLRAAALTSAPAPEDR